MDFDEGDGREPFFNYSRFLPHRALHPATITCGSLHHRFLAVGSSAGNVHIYELNGGGAEWRRIACHTSRINDVSSELVRVAFFLSKWQWRAKRGHAASARFLRVRFP